MANSARCARLTVAALVVCGLIGSAYAQRVIQLTATRIVGKIAKIGRGAILVSSSSGQNWTVKLTPRTAIKITGTAGPDMLTPGVCVHFVATINKRTSRGQDKVNELTIFTETPGDDDRTLGVMRASDKPPAADRAPGGPGPGKPGPGAQGVGGQGAGAGPGLDLDATNNNKGPRQRPTNKASDKSGPEAESFDIAAQVVSFRGGKLIVTVQNKYFKPRINVDLDPSVKISLDLGDFSHVSPGDLVTVRGIYATPGLAEAVSVDVELAKPLGNVRNRHYAARPATGKDHVAKAAGKADAKPAEEDKKTNDIDVPAIADDAPKPAEGAATPANQELELAKFLAPTPADIQARPSFAMTLGRSAPEEYKPCKQVLSKDLRTRFGPTKIAPSPIQGNLPDGSGQGKSVTWEVWTYGKIKILVDEHSQTVYMAGAPEVPSEAPSEGASGARAPAADSTTTESPTAPPEAKPKPSDTKPAGGKPASSKPAGSKPTDKGEDKDVFDK